MKPVFMIVDPDAFVAEDLSEIIRETVSDAQVIHASVMDGHMLQVVTEMSVYGVFLSGASDDAALIQVADDLARRNVALAWTGTATQRGLSVARAGMSHGELPMTAEGVQAVIRQWNLAKPLPRPRPGQIHEGPH